MNQDLDLVFLGLDSDFVSFFGLESEEVDLESPDFESEESEVEEESPELSLLSPPLLSL